MTRDGRILPPATIVVVEDDPSIREALGVILRDRYRILFVADAPPALDLVRGQRPDLVILDLDLPTIDGFDVLASIRAIAPHQPVVVLTIMTETKVVLRAMRQGVLDYITKPFRDEDVLASISAVLTGRRHVDNYYQGNYDGVHATSNGECCLVLVGHLGTAGTLKLILGRYMPTHVATDGVTAVRVLGATTPAFVVCDEESWAADGAALVRLFRYRNPGCRVALISSRERGDAGARGAIVDTVMFRDVGLRQMVPRILDLCFGLLTQGRPQDLSDYVMRALDYLCSRYAQRVEVQTVADAVPISRSRLAELFRAELGRSVSRYAAELHIEVAKILLRNGSRKLDEVASQAGFSDVSHFSRTFTRHMGQRPGAYRRELSIR